MSSGLLSQANFDLLCDLYEDESSKDIEIQCSDGSLRAHACILSAASQPLKAMLDGRFAEGCSQQVQLKHLTVENVRFILRALYTGRFEIEDGPDLVENRWSKSSVEASGAADIICEAHNILTTRDMGGTNFVIRGEKQYERGQHYFEVKVLQRNEDGNGYHILGVGTDEANECFVDEACGDHVWGIYLDDHCPAMLVHAGRFSHKAETIRFEENTVYGVHLDCETGKLTFFVDGRKLDVEFDNLKGKGPFHPVLCVGCLHPNSYEANFKPLTWPAGFERPNSAPLENFFALASFAKQYDMMQFAGAAIEVIKRSISVAKFDRIMKFANRFDISPIRLAGLDFARSSQDVRDLFDKEELSAEVMWDLQAIWAAPMRKKRRCAAK